MIQKELLLVIFIGVIVLYYIARFFTIRAMRRQDAIDELNKPVSVKDNATRKHDYSSDECAEGGCGMRAICSGKEDVKFDYYEDEELDNYKGRDAASYTEYEVSEFRDVLVTLRGNEVAPWLNSLCARGVSLPSQLRAEAIALVKKNEQ